MFNGCFKVLKGSKGFYEFRLWDFRVGGTGRISVWFYGVWFYGDHKVHRAYGILGFLCLQVH